MKAGRSQSQGRDVMHVGIGGVWGWMFAPALAFSQSPDAIGAPGRATLG